MEILKTLGTGNESVYVYYYPNDRLLASALGEDVWECKIGMTATGDVVKRISEQGPRASRHQDPIIALEIRTENAVLLESRLHRAFYAERIHIGEITGDEWFMVNPEQIEGYYFSDAHESNVGLTMITPYIIEDSVSLGRVIKKQRQRLKLRQEDLGVARMLVNRLENNNGAIQTASLFELVKNLNCRLAIVPRN